MRLVRTFLPSAIRRGRMATSPVWRVIADGDFQFQFTRKKDAESFIANGGCPEHEHVCCRHCHGVRLL